MKKLISGLKSMCRPAYLVLLWSVGACCAMMAAALVLVCIGTPFSVGPYWLFFSANVLQQAVRVILFFSIFISAFLEEHRRT